MVWQCGPHELLARLIAARLNMLDSWVLWNSSNRYNWAALTPQACRALVDPGYNSLK